MRSSLESPPATGKSISVSFALRACVRACEAVRNDLWLGSGGRIWGGVHALGGEISKV